jgi:predicted outer membrane lipoprotein
MAIDLRPPKWRTVLWVVIGVLFAAGFGIDYIILGHGVGIAAKILSFFAGWMSGSLITTAWFEALERRREKRLSEIKQSLRERRRDN